MMEKEVRFVVVFNNETKQFYIDEDMACAVFDESDIWLVEDSEWVGAAYDMELYTAAFGLLNEKIGGGK